jgi:hypothetical protein
MQLAHAIAVAKGNTAASPPHVIPQSVEHDVARQASKPGVAPSFPSPWSTPHWARFVTSPLAADMHDSSGLHDVSPAHLAASLAQFVATHVAQVPCP